MNEKGSFQEKLGSYLSSPLIESGTSKYLIRRAWASANNNHERKIFLGILRRAYEKIMELEILYKELGGIIKNDHAAIQNFQNILHNAALRQNQRENLNREDKMKGRNNSVTQSDKKLLHSKSDENPNSNRNLHIITPEKISLLLQGVYLVSEKTGVSFKDNSDSFLALWRQVYYLDQFYKQSLLVNNPERDRYGESLRIISRDCETRKPPNDPVTRDDGRITRDRTVSEHDEFNRRPRGDAGMPHPEEDFDFPLSDYEDVVCPLPDPDDSVIPGFDNPMDFFNECMEMLIDAMGSGRIRVPNSVWSDGITSISPTTACAGQSLTIRGSGFDQPSPDVTVVIGGLPVEWSKWTDTEIIVTIAEDIRSGCVGFRNEKIEAERVKAIKQNRETLKRTISSLRCMGTNLTGVHVFDYAELFPASAPCNGFNFFEGTIPEIDFFRVNGKMSETVTPDENIILTWQVRNYDTLEVKRITSEGPFIFVTNPANNVVDLGKFTERHPVECEYRLLAKNACGEVSQTISVKLKQDPALKIEGIEVVQVIQHFDIKNPSKNNSVPLVSDKPTLVRVYISSGINNGFDNGDDPNKQGNITGELELYDVKNYRSIRSVRPSYDNDLIKVGPVDEVEKPEFRSAPLNENRTLNFDFIGQNGEISGEIRIRVKVWVKDHEEDFVASDSVLVNFYPKRNVNLYVILVWDDLHNLPKPNWSVVGNLFDESASALPLRADGFNIYPGRHPIIKTDRGRNDLPANNDPNSPFPHISTSGRPGSDPSYWDIDLTTERGWSTLLDIVEDIADDTADADSYTFVGLIPRPPSGLDLDYENNGKAMRVNPGRPFEIFLPESWIDTHKHLVTINSYETFVHELLHTMGVRHANCPPQGHRDAKGNPDFPENVEYRAAINTEDIGMKAHWVFFRPTEIIRWEMMKKGSPDFMTYCSRSPDVPNCRCNDYKWMTVWQYRSIFGLFSYWD